MRKQFDIKYRPQIESGEYKVIDRFGYVLTLRDIINDVWYFSLRYPNTDYETERIYDHPENHLFLVTPEEEMTEFEKAFLERVFHQKAEDLDEENREIFREDARCVLELAREELFANDAVLKEYAEVAREQGKAEAMKDLPRWKTCFFQMGTKNPFPRYLVRMGGAHYSLTSTILKCDEYIPLSELAKLPRED